VPGSTRARDFGRADNAPGYRLHPLPFYPVQHRAILCSASLFTALMLDDRTHAGIKKMANLASDEAQTAARCARDRRSRFRARERVDATRERDAPRRQRVLMRACAVAPQKGPLLRAPACTSRGFV